MEEDEYTYGAGGQSSKKKSSKGATSYDNIRLTEGDDKYPSDIPKGTKKINSDWIDVLGVVREVIDQGNRRTCWTIASTRSLSGRLVAARRFNHPLGLSALHLLIGLIDKVDSSGGIRKLEDLQKFLIEHGTILEEDCKCPPLALAVDKSGKSSASTICTEKNKNKHVCVFKVKDLVIKKPVDERELIVLLEQGPVAVGIEVHQEFKNFKGDGIYLGPNKGSKKKDDHLFLLYGYGTKMPEQTHYWKVQNSAGTNWGENGYGKIIRQISRDSGAPSLFTCVVYPELLDHYEGERENIGQRRNF